MLKHKKQLPFWRYAWPVVVIIGGLTAALIWYTQQHTVAVLQPAGPIAAGEKSLLITATLLMLIIVVPVLVLAIYIAWRYREQNKAPYKPNWDKNIWIEAIWWGVPTIIIVILAVMTWISTHQYDPYKPLAGDNPVSVQVVALDWRWLFIYPDYGIATVNHLVIPEDRPIAFSITADAPMNSFWIPQLGGQVYAMTGMSTKLHLQADDPGTYYGSAANISGEGFAKMRFSVTSVTDNDFTKWIAVSKQKPTLSLAGYEQLALPSHDTTAYTFGNSEPRLYDKIMGKYHAR